MPHNSEAQIPPEPENPGTTPEQEKSAPVQVPVVLPAGTEGISEYPQLTGTLKEMIDTGVRGQTAMLLLQVNTARIESDLSRSRAEATLLQRKVDEWKDSYYESQKHCSVLKEKISGLIKFRVLQNAMITAGTLLSGVSLKYMEGQNASLAGVGILAGIMLMLLGWLYKYPNGGEK